MSRVIEGLQHRAARDARPVLDDGQRAMTAAALLRETEMLSGTFGRRRARAVALLADNGIDWVISDLAAIHAGVPLLPLPAFFTPAQMRHAVDTAGADHLLAPAALAASSGLDLRDEGPATGSLRRYRLHTPARRLPAGTSKITFTSGTTGQPKGVCLAQSTLETVAASLVAASEAGADDVHLCVLPLATLLENIGGLYAPLLAGARAAVLPLAAVGFSGSSHFDPSRLIAAIDAVGATSLILVPELLKALVMALEAGAPRLPALRFVAVGGAPLPASWLARARQLDLPVYEGYGLSECASVVSLNRAAADRAGSVGRSLPHVQLRVADDGEIHVRGASALGYAGTDDSPPQDEIATGDLGHLDAEGYLHVTGRKKHQFITSFGRNVCPEWVERRLCESPEILQAAVFGEARPWNAAVVVSSAAAAVLDAALACANRDLPDYAQIRRWIRATEPFSAASGQLTANGRVRRDAVLAAYRAQLDALYPSTMEMTCS